MKIVRYWRGRKQTYTLPEKSRQRIVKALRTRTTSTKVIENIASLNKGKFGSSHPCYRNEKKHPFHKLIRETYKYRLWRTKTFERDNYKCVLCGFSGYVEADHYPRRFIEIIRDNKINTLDQALDCEELWACRGRTLCRGCHLKNFSRLVRK